MSHPPGTYTGSYQRYGTYYNLLTTYSIATITSTATIYCTSDLRAVETDYQTLLNEGVVLNVASNGRGLDANGDVVNSGTIEGTATGVQLTHYTLWNEAGGLISGSIGVDLFGTGPTVVNDGTIVSTAGTHGIAVKFDGQYETLIEGSDSKLVGHISGFAAGDTIDLTGVAFNGKDHVTYKPGHLIVAGAEGTYADLAVGAVTIADGDEWNLASDGHGGTDIVIGSGDAGTYDGSREPGGTYSSILVHYLSATIASTITVSNPSGNPGAVTDDTYGGTLLNEGLLIAQSIALANCTLNNTGTIEGGGISLLRSGQITNTGTIEAAGGGTAVETEGVYSGGLDNKGLIEVTGTGGVGLRSQDGTDYNSGIITASYDGVYVVSQGTFYNQLGGIVSGLYGVVLRSEVTLINAGTIESTSGTLGTAVNFFSKYNPTGMTLVEKSTGVLVGNIANFGAGDTIDLAGVAFESGESVTYEAGHLIVSGAGGTYADLAAVGITIASRDELTAVNDGAGGTDIEIKVRSPGIYSGSYTSIYVQYSPAKIEANAIVGNSTVDTAVGLRSGTVSNDGLITSYGTGVGLEGAATLFNDGTIDVSNEAICVANEDNLSRIQNFGLIEANSSHAVGIEFAGYGVNSGTVAATGSASVGVRFISRPGDFSPPQAASTLSNAVGGVISGAIGAVFYGTFDTLFNAGTVESSAGGSGIAVEFDTYSLGNAIHDTLIEESSGVLVGKIDGFHAGNTIDLAGVTYHAGEHVTYQAGEMIVSGPDGTYANLAMTGVVLSDGQEPAVKNDGSGGTDIVIRSVDPGNYSGTHVVSGTYKNINVSYSLATIASTAVVNSQTATAAVSMNFGSDVLLNDGVVVNGYGQYTLLVATAAQVTNAGKIEMTGSNDLSAAIEIRLPDYNVSNNNLYDCITNEPGGVISGNIGVELNVANSTIVNAGTIQSTSRYAVELDSANDMLSIRASAKFIGTIASSYGRLRFAGNDGGTVSGLGSGTLGGSVPGIFVGFRNYLVGAQANWVLAGSNVIDHGKRLINQGSLVETGSLTIAAEGSLVNDGTLTISSGVLIDNSTLGGTGTIQITQDGTLDLLSAASGHTIDFLDGTGVLDITNPSLVTLAVDGFVVGDKLDLTGVGYQAGDTVTDSDGQLELFNSSNKLLADLDVTGLSGDPLRAVDDGSGETAIEVVCFLEGTRIRTERGEVAVEALAEGDLVLTASGAREPVKWIGKRRMNAKRHPSPDKVYPIRIKRNAFADGVPMRDLLVSPGHAIFANGVLIPAHRLVNGVTVFQDFEIAEPYYFHIELERHDVLLAEGLAAESYLDSGNRGFFENGRRPVELFALPDGRCRAKGRCAPLKNGGMEAAAVKQGLLRRVQAMGYAAGRRPELRLQIDGRVVLPVSTKRRTYTFELPLNYREVRLVSQTAIGGATRAGSFDTRRLGVAVLDVMHDAEAIDLRRLGEGWHRIERDGGKRFRWSDGDALLPVAGPGTLEIRLLRPVERWIRQVDLVKLRQA